METVSLGDLFSTSKFEIPQYQRAYSWDIKPQLHAFLEDLRQLDAVKKENPGKRFFLGTLLLHQENKKSRNIVDGQQRLTTAVTFVATGLRLYKEGRIHLEERQARLLRRKFVYDEDADEQKLCTIVEDQPFFRATILAITDTLSIPDTQSAKRLEEASSFFAERVSADEWPRLLDVVENAQVMVYSVDNPGDATQIFELQNDRGKQLTDLEALKSCLMHTVFLRSKNPDDSLKALQGQFSRIYRFAEQLESVKGAPGEDRILSYHCVAFLDWSEDEWRQPKELVKEVLKVKPPEQAVAWISQFVTHLVESYRTVDILFRHRDSHSAFAELVVLNKLAPFWPLLLKTWEADPSEEKGNFEKTCRLLEVYAFRGYAISNIRADGGTKTLYRDARDFAGDFESLFDHLSDLCYSHDIENRFFNGLDSSRLYEVENSDLVYLLWRYENQLRSQTGQKQALFPWQDILEPQSFAVHSSIEHIASQTHPLSEKEVDWGDGKMLPFKEVALHRLGNLVLDSVSLDSGRSNKDFADKLEHLSKKSQFLSQGELLQWSSEKDDEGKPLWTVQSVKARHKHLVDFALAEWNPEKYHKRSAASEG